MNRRTKRLACVLLVIGGLGVIVMMYTPGLYPKVIGHAYDKKIIPVFNQKANDNSPSYLNSFNEDGDPSQIGKTKVFRYNGRYLERLRDFCTWALPMDCADLKTPQGSLKIFIHDVEDDPGLSGVLKKTGIRDPENVAIIINELNKYPDAGFFDFGSHIGVYGLSVAHELGRNVVCIDPMIENTARLCKSIEFNNFTEKMTIVYNAISNQNTEVNFKRAHHHIGATKVVTSATSGDSPCDRSVHYSVRLDDVIPVVSFKRAVMKLDVEMSEYFVIQGGLRFLREIDVRSILMEWYNIVTTPHAEALVGLLKEMKYVPYIPYTNGNHKLVKYEDYKFWTKYKPMLDVLWIKE